MNIKERRAHRQAQHDADRARFDADRARHAARIRVLNLITATSLGAAAFFHLLHFIKWMFING